MPDNTCNSCGDEVEEDGVSIGTLHYCKDCMSEVSDGYLDDEKKVETGESFGYRR